MTYCIGILVRDGLVMMADTRTNAGVDNISTYRKLRVFGTQPGRCLAVSSAGSLSVTQAAVAKLTDAMTLPGADERDTLDNAPSMFRAAQLVGIALREAKSVIEATIDNDKIATGASLLFGGSIGGRKPRLFLIYGSGNFIECQSDTPFLQIGEHKYGKPILDRQITYDTPIAEAIKVGLISFSSTMRSNLAVGLPIDLLTIEPGCSEPGLNHRIDHEDAYYRELDDRWGAALQAAQREIPTPPYGPPQVI
ncbi:peptidase [Glacieibacterium sp.]|uniref:peptidase n=1 Tax=Glacieibacterium sp. TaxID=2860237 RepID=UPI003B00A9E0